MTICHACGCSTINPTRIILWPDLISAWQLAPHEVRYINAQQGKNCSQCGSNLRSIVLAKAILSGFRADGPLSQFVESSQAKSLKVLEINEAGTLHPFLRQMPGHTFGAYPALDIHAMPFPDHSFDLVVHSDTLEHVPNPEHALSECARVLKPDGLLCYTVPVIVGRLSRGRDGLSKSWHGDPSQTGDDWLVQTEFGADFWITPVEAGFSRVELHTLEFPSAIAVCARR